MGDRQIDGLGERQTRWKAAATHAYRNLCLLGEQRAAQRGMGEQRNVVALRLQGRRDRSEAAKASMLTALVEDMNSVEPDDPSGKLLARRAHDQPDYDVRDRVMEGPHQRPRKHDVAHKSGVDDQHARRRHNRCVVGSRAAGNRSGRRRAPQRPQKRSLLART